MYHSSLVKIRLPFASILEYFRVFVLSFSKVSNQKFEKKLLPIILYYVLFRKKIMFHYCLKFEYIFASNPHKKKTLRVNPLHFTDEKLGSRNINFLKLTQLNNRTEFT